METQIVGGQRKVAMFVVSGETTNKIEGLQGCEYAAFIPRSLYVIGDTMYGIAITCHNTKVLFAMPLRVFEEVQIQEHTIR